MLINHIRYWKTCTQPYLIYWLILKCLVLSHEKISQSTEGCTGNHNNTCVDILDGQNADMPTCESQSDLNSAFDTTLHMVGRGVVFPASGSKV